MFLLLVRLLFYNLMKMLCIKIQRIEIKRNKIQRIEIQRNKIKRKRINKSAYK